jgi:hypothetical protein
VLVSSYKVRTGKNIWEIWHLPGYTLVLLWLGLTLIMSKSSKSRITKDPWQILQNEGFVSPHQVKKSDQHRSWRAQYDRDSSWVYCWYLYVNQYFIFSLFFQWGVILTVWFESEWERLICRGTGECWWQSNDERKSFWCGGTCLRLSVRTEDKIVINNLYNYVTISEYYLIFECHSRVRGYLTIRAEFSDH